MATPTPSPAPRASQVGTPPQDPSAPAPTSPQRASQISSPQRASQISSPQRGSQMAPPQQRESQMAAAPATPQGPLQRASQSNPSPRKSQPSPTNSRRSSVVPALALPKKGSVTNPSPQGSPTKRPSQRSPTRRGSQISTPSQGEKAPGQETEISRKPSQMPAAQGVDARRASQAPAQAQEVTPSHSRPSTSQGARRASQASPSLPSIKEIAAEGSPDSPSSSQGASSPSPSGESPSPDSSPSLLTPSSDATSSDSTAQPTESTSDQPEQPKEPARAVSYRERPEKKVMRRISLEMRHRMFLMGMRVTVNEMGPTGCIFYVMGEIGKTFVVKLKEFPCCQCGDFLLQRLCKHMMFISLRVFKLEQTDHRIWQNALLPSELKSLLAHPLITPPVKPAFRSKLRRPLLSQQLQQPPQQPPPPSPEPQPPAPPPKEIPICCPVCFDEIQFFDNEVKKPLGAKKGLKPKLDMGTRRKKEDYAKVEEVLAEPWAMRTKKWESLLHCPTQNCQSNGCMKVVHEICYLKWSRFRVMNYELPHVCTINNFYPCAFTAH